MLCLFLCLLPRLAFADITSNLVAHWKLDTANGTTPDETGTNTATLINTPAVVAGKIGNGIAFVRTENDRLDVADHASIDLGTGDFSIAFWIQAGNSTTAHWIVVKGNPPNVGGIGYDVLYRGDQANDPIELRTNDTTGTAFMRADVGDITTGWFHIAVACDRNVKCDIYKDGIDIADDTDITARQGTYDNAAELCVGSNSASNNCTTSGTSFDGQLDDLRIYKRYLSAADVGELVALGSPSARRILHSQ